MKKIKKILALSLVAAMLLNMTLSQVTVFAGEVSQDFGKVDQSIEKDQTSETSLSFDLENIEETIPQAETETDETIEEDDEETIENKLPEEEPEDKNDYVDESDESTKDETSEEIETSKEANKETKDFDVETETDEENETEQKEIKEETSDASQEETSAEEIDEIITDEDLKEILDGTSESEIENKTETTDETEINDEIKAETEIESETTIEESNPAYETSAKPVEEIDIATVSEAEEIEYIEENDTYAPVATSSEADAEEIVILDEIIATLSEIKAESNAIRPIKFVTATNSIIINSFEKTDRGFKLTNDIEVNNTIYIVDDELYVQEGDYIFTSEDETEKLEVLNEYDSIEEYLSKNHISPSKEVLFDLNGNDITKVSFKVLSSHVDFYGNNELTGDDTTVENSYNTDELGVIKADVAKDAIYLDNSKISVNMAYVYGGDGIDYSEDEADGKSAVYFSPSTSNYLKYVNGALRGGDGAKRYGSEESYGGAPIKYKDVYYCPSKTQPGIRGEEGCGNGGDAIHVESRKQAKNIEIVSYGISGGNGGKISIRVNTKRAYGSFESYYCSVDDDIVTPTKQQGQTGNCWAFTTCAVAETSLLKHFANYVMNILGKTVSNLNFSENHLAYYINIPNDTVLTDTTITALGDPGAVPDPSKDDRPLYTRRGNHARAAGNYLSAGNDLVLEDRDPSFNSTFGVNDVYPYFPVQYTDMDTKLRNSYEYSQLTSGFVPNGTNHYTIDPDVIKQAIKDRGAVFFSLDYDSRSYRTAQDRHGNNVYAIFKPKSVSRDAAHAITCIGWDDDFAKENFRANDGTVPSINGAWIIKNSWGENRYVYLSYEYDITLGHLFAGFDFVPPAVVGDNLYNVRTYIDSYYTGRRGYATVYKVKEDVEFAKAISLYAFEQTDDATVSLYKLSADTVTKIRNELTDANKIVSTTVTLHGGINYIEFPTNAMLKKGSIIACVVQSNSSFGVGLQECQTDFTENTHLYKTNTTINAYIYAKTTSGSFSWFAENKSDYVPALSLHTVKIPEKYKVIYNGNLTGVATVTKEYDRLNTNYVFDDETTIGNPISTAVPGYIFQGFSKDPNATTATYTDTAIVSTMAKEIYPSSDSNDINLYGIWTPKTYAVKFDANDAAASGSMNDATKTFDTDLTLPANAFTLKGKRIKGWSTNSSSTSADIDDGASVTDAQLGNSDCSAAEVTLYAIWETLPPVNITLNYNGGTGATPSIIVATVDDPLPSVSQYKPTKSGYTFNGYWTSTSGGVQYYNASGVGVKDCDFTSDITLYANWKANGGGGGGGGGSGGGGGGGGGGGSLPSTQNTEGYSSTIETVKETSTSILLGTWSQDPITAKWTYDGIDALTGQHADIANKECAIAYISDAGPVVNYYYFDNDSKMYQGFLTDVTGNTYYYKEGTGADAGMRVSQFQYINHNLYYFDITTGVMLKAGNIDALVFDAEGKCINATNEIVLALTGINPADIPAAGPSVSPSQNGIMVYGASAGVDSSFIGPVMQSGTTAVMNVVKGR